MLGANANKGQENIPAAISDIGCEREINEDRYAVIDSRAGRAWIVCDGMGGVLGGDLAAQLSIDAIRRGLESRTYSSPSEALKSAIEEANRVITLRRQNPVFGNMGTTIVAVIILDNELVLANAGDSRGYLVRHRAIQQLTTDHTYVQNLVDRGAISADDALSHPQAHVLTRCIGAEARLQLDIQQYWIWSVESGEPEDRLILCSDGLYGLVSDDELAEICTDHPPQESCVQLVELAKARGGYDNITIAIIPLGGQLREEDPGSQQSMSQRMRLNRNFAPPKESAPISMGRQLAIVFFLFLLGMVISALLLLQKL